MGRILKQLLGGGFFDQLAQIHNGDIVGKMIDNRQVMCDKHVGQSHLLLKLFHQVQNLRLDGHVQGRNRLVADDELGIQRQCPGDTDSLPAAAVQLVGIGVDQTVGKTYDLHQLTHPLHLFGRVGDDLVDLKRISDDLAHCLTGI